MNDKKRPALIGGIVLGLLSAIPFLNLGNMCCCMWVLGGGALAAYLYINSSLRPVSVGEGAQLGFLAGAVGVVILFVVGLPLGLLAQNAMNGLIVDFVTRMNPAAAEQVRQQVALELNKPFIARLPQLIGYSIMSAVVTLIFATLGGLLGVVLFEKRKVEGGRSLAAPPPPPGFGPGR
jgi:hypothetical protein